MIFVYMRERKWGPIVDLYGVFLARRSSCSVFSFHWYGQRRCFIVCCVSDAVDNLLWGLTNEGTYKVSLVIFCYILPLGSLGCKSAMFLVS